MKVLRITPERCTGCMRCELACSYMQTGTFQPAKSVIRISPFEAHTSYAPYTCTQCAAWCLSSPAPWRRSPSRRSAPKWSGTTCAWGANCAPSRVPTAPFSTIPTPKAFKCNLCEGSPACAEACPTAAIEYVETATSDWLGDFAAQRSAGHLAQLAGQA